MAECSVAGNVADPWCVFSPWSLPAPPFVPLPSEPVVPGPMYHATDINYEVTGAVRSHANVLVHIKAEFAYVHKYEYTHAGKYLNVLMINYTHSKHAMKF